MSNKDRDVSLADIQAAAGGNYSWAFSDEPDEPLDNPPEYNEPEHRLNDNQVSDESGELSDNSTVVPSVNAATTESEAVQSDESGDSTGQSTQPNDAAPPPPEPTNQEGEVPAWYTALSPEAKQNYDAAAQRAAEAERLKAKLNSMTGRIQSHQDLTAKHSQAAQEVKRLRDELERRRTATPTSVEEWEQVIKEEPKLAKAIDARIAQLLGNSETALTERMVNLAEPQVEGREHELRNNELSRLDEMVGTTEWREWTKTPEWKAWLTHQPPAVRTAAVSSPNAEDAYYVIAQFYNDMQGLAQQVQSNQPDPAAQQVNKPNAATPPVQVDKVVARRQQALNDTSVVSGRSPAASVNKSPVQSEADFERLLAENIRAVREGRPPVVS